MILNLISCEEYFSAVPWPETGLVCLACFVLGAILGRTWGRRHPRTTSREQKGAHDG